MSNNDDSNKESIHIEGVAKPTIKIGERIIKDLDTYIPFCSKETTKKEDD